jgi:hypothetical protein
VIIPLNQTCATSILTYLFGALEIKNSFTVFDLSILLIAGLTKLNTFVVAVDRNKKFRGSHAARGPEVAQACSKPIIDSLIDTTIVLNMNHLKLNTT